MKDITNKLEQIKIENLCSAEDYIKRIRRQMTDWGKMFTKTSEK